MLKYTIYKIAKLKSLELTSISLRIVQCLFWSKIKIQINITFSLKDLLKNL